MSEEKKEDILSSFEGFKSYLGDKVSKGEKLGMNEEQLAKTAQKVADYLAKHEEPRNREETASRTVEGWRQRTAASPCPYACKISSINKKDDTLPCHLFYLQILNSGNDNLLTNL